MEVAEGVVLLGVFVDLDGGFVGAEDTMEGFVQGWEQSGAAGDAEAGMLAAADEGFEGLGLEVTVVESASNGVTESINLLGWELHGAVSPIENPAQNLLTSVPNAFPLKNEFLLGDGVLPIVAGGSWWWEDLVLELKSKINGIAIS